MSTYYRRTKHPETGRFEEATWIDDHFGRHRYGVQFPDGKIYRQSDHQWEFDDPPSMVYSWPPPERKVMPPPAIPPMVPSAKERIDAVYEAWVELDQDPDIEILHERAMQQAYEDGFAAGLAAARTR